jgi:hypothetical protein
MQILQGKYRLGWYSTKPYARLQCLVSSRIIPNCQKKELKITAKKKNTPYVRSYSQTLHISQILKKKVGSVINVYILCITIIKGKC